LVPIENLGAFEPTGSDKISTELRLVFIYLNSGTGKPCAWQRNEKPIPDFRSIDTIFASNENFGAREPTGSIEKFVLRRYSFKLPVRWDREPLSLAQKCKSRCSFALN
jgi:hypothetical protein